MARLYAKQLPDSMRDSKAKEIRDSSERNQCPKGNDQSNSVSENEIRSHCLREKASKSRRVRICKGRESDTATIQSCDIRVLVQTMLVERESENIREREREREG